MLRMHGNAICGGNNAPTPEQAERSTEVWYYIFIDIFGSLGGHRRNDVACGLFPRSIVCDDQRSDIADSEI